jgi:hypothetical protein
MENHQLKAIVILLLVLVGGGILTSIFDSVIGYNYTQGIFLQQGHDLIQKIQGGAIVLAYLWVKKAFAK